MGYPKTAIITDKGDDEYHNKIDKEKFAKLEAMIFRFMYDYRGRIVEEDNQKSTDLVPF
ncbi:hypothetical protein H5P36_17535 [Bacillus sp. APMAM]|nr:hypothetical protein [Bacillus sp. APMAM]